MHKHNYPLLLINLLFVGLLTACQSVNMIQSNKKTSFQYSGNYATAYQTKDSYHQTLTISPNSQDNQHYQVVFSATKVRGRAGCSFIGTAMQKDGVLWLNVSNEADKKVAMYLRPTKDKLGIDVFTKNFDERFMMMRYCRGGGSLAGRYLRHQ